jgi:hypothetical protein
MIRFEIEYWRNNCVNTQWVENTDWHNVVNQATQQGIMYYEILSIKAVSA